MNEKTKHFGLIGFPLGHSFSKKFFSEKFEKENINARYELYPLENIEMFPALINANEFTGLNVTIPYKQQVMPYLDELDETATIIGAVNVIRFSKKNDSKHLKGYNTDAIGFENSIKPFLKSHHQKALILGTGGASKAVDYSLRKLGLETTYVSRNNATGILTYKDLNRDIISENTVIVNCTPSGMYPKTDECPEIPYNYISPNHLLYDVIYKPDETLFLKKGKEQRACTVNGMEMLNGQAIAAWKIWNS